MTINLTTPIGIAITGPNPVNETDSQAGITLLDVDYNAQIATFTIRQGTAQVSILNAGVFPGTVLLSINMQTGAWTSTDSVNPSNNKSGTFTGAAFTTFVNMMKNLRNTVEGFVAGSSGILPGTQVNWP